MDETTSEERAWMIHIHRIVSAIKAENDERKTREITGSV